jgi:hypothetical protein
VFFPAHASNQLQALDLSIFGVTKRLIARVNRTETYSIQTKHIARVVGSFMSAATPLNITQAFRLSDLRLILDEIILRAQVWPAAAGRLLHPITNGFEDTRPLEEGETDDDEEDVKLSGEERARLLYDPTGERDPSEQ